MIQIYSGKGKGKTTAAVGAAVRGAGAGMKVLFYQFLKNGSSSEIDVLKGIRGITVRCCSSCHSFVKNMTQSERDVVYMEHNKMFYELLQAIEHHDGDMIILDEFLNAYEKDMFDKSMGEKVIMAADSSCELILTGRKADELFTSIADYHSEITALKHPFEKGVKARKGIEF